MAGVRVSKEQQYDTSPFTYQEALQLWSRLVAGWAHHLDSEGARTLFDGNPNFADYGGAYEGVTRMLWSLGGWLSYPERTSCVTWRGETFDLEQHLRRALVNGCDPASPSYWGRGYVTPGGYDQRTVECGQIAFCVWQTRERVWNHLDSREQTSIIDFLTLYGQRPMEWRSNWALFWALNHACRKALGAPYDQAIIDDVIHRYLDAVYCGDGWYDDAPQRGPGYFDDYNTWVFGSHVLAWAQCDGHTQPERRDELLDRIRHWMNHYPYFFAENGAYNEFGRSLAYKFARLGAPLWAYKLGVWPHSVGILKRLVGRHLRWYIDRGAARADGTLRQPLTAWGSVEICEPYIATGSTYWAMQAFGGLWSLADDDPFWTVEEEPLPAEQDPFQKVFVQPGWIVTANDGEVQRFNAGSVAPSYGAKYSRYVYSTSHPFNVGLSSGSPAPDNMLCLVENEVYGQRTRNLAHTVSEMGWLRIRYEQTLNGVTHVIETVIVIQGEDHIRAHRVHLNPASQSPLSALEGSAPLGYIQGQHPAIQSGPNWQALSVEGRSSAILNLEGYDRASVWNGASSINSVYPYALVPVLTLHSVQPDHQLLCLCHIGKEIDVNRWTSQTIKGVWMPDDTFELTWNGREISVPPLP